MRKMFSENQIKNIVNQGIESGEISGGTKLYLHHVELYIEAINGDIDNTFYLSIITPNADRIESIEDITNYANVYLENGQYILFFNYESISNDYIFGFDLNNKTILAGSIIDISFEDDTVTPL